MEFLQAVANRQEEQLNKKNIASKQKSLLTSGR